jgi:hypothetical protein
MEHHAIALVRITESEKMTFAKPNSGTQLDTNWHQNRNRAALIACPFHNTRFPSGYIYIYITVV